MARKKGDLARYVSRYIDPSLLKRIKHAEREDDWHLLLSHESFVCIANSKFRGKRIVLPSIESSTGLTPSMRLFVEESKIRKIIELKIDDEINNYSGQSIRWKTRARDFFGVSIKTIENWVREYNIQTPKEKRATLKLKAIASLKKLRRSK